MRPASHHNKRLTSDASNVRNRPSTSSGTQQQRAWGWSPILIESIQPTSPRSASRGAIIEIEQDLRIDDKISLKSSNLFNCLSLPHDQVTNLIYSNNYISKIEKIQHLMHLVFLDFSNNQLEEITGLPHAPCLKVLLLGQNRIRKIQNLNAHVNLDVLDLSVNFIEAIEGLDKLQNLRVLNLESNKITHLPDIGYLSNLTELNVTKNKINSMAVLNIGTLKRLKMSSNQIKDVQLCSNFSSCNQLFELVLDGNPMANNISYRASVIAKLRYLKVLDGKRITEEERRTSLKLERKASEKRLEAEKIIQRDNEKKCVLDNISKDWDSKKSELFIYPSLNQTKSSKFNSKPSSALKRTIKVSSQINDGGYYQILLGQLEIYGNALNILESLDHTGITSITFNMIHIEDILRFYPVIAKYRSLVKLTFNRTMIEYLHQFNLFKSLEIRELNISSDDNPICSIRIIKNYLIYTLKSLSKFQGFSITETERNAAWIQFGVLRHMIATIPPRLLTKNQTKFIPFSHLPLKKKCFTDFESENESSESESEERIRPAHEQLSASNLISCALKQKTIIEEFNLKWTEMINDVLIYALQELRVLFAPKMIHSVLLINKAGGLIYNKDFTSNLNKLTSNESLVLAGTLHGIHALTAQISPVPNSTGFQVFECGQFKIYCHQTLTGLKIIILCDPPQSNVDHAIRRIYEIYSDYAMKCPFVKLDMPLRSELFDSNMQKLIRSINS